MNFFSSITLERWQQFESVTIDFSARLTIITGANGSGKSTLLRILAKHRGWPSTLIATPTRNVLTGAIEYLTRFFRGEDKSRDTVIGVLRYSNDQSSALAIPQNGNGVAYDIQLQSMQHIECFFMPSHRQVFRYEAVGHIPAAKKNEQTAFDEVYSTSIQRLHGNGGQSASFYMKSTLIGWAIQGMGVKDGNKVIMAADEAQRQSYHGFQQILQQLLPSNLGFEEFEIRNMEIVFVCNGGTDQFLLETASGGVAAIIDLAWQIFMFSRGAAKGLEVFTVIIDEVENHLHPSLQKELLPKLLTAFPQARFVVSTHSPLVVSSVRDANVFVLRYNSDRKVESLRLDLSEKTRSASEILDEVLGVSSSLPTWAETELEQILRDVLCGPSTPNTFATLRERLRAIGLEHILPDMITKVLDKA